MENRQFKRGDRKSTNNWLRMRVAAQAFTVVAIFAFIQPTGRILEKLNDTSSEAIPMKTTSRHPVYRSDH